MERDEQVTQPDRAEWWRVKIDTQAKQLIDAQATIAALQVDKENAQDANRLLRRELDKLREKYDAECVMSEGLQSHLTQRTTELHETQNHLADADNEVEQLRKQLSERTAELEAVSNFIGVQYDAETRTWVSGQAPYLSAGTTKQEACIAAVDALRLACATWETKYRDLQAELERVRAERDEYLENLGLCKGNELAAELDTLKGLIAALPKVEGEMSEYICDVWIDDARKPECLPALAALLQHRQGME